MFFKRISLFPREQEIKVVFIFSPCFPPIFHFVLNRITPIHKYAYDGDSHREREGKIKGLFILWRSGGLLEAIFECRVAGTFVFISRFTDQKLLAVSGLSQ